MTDDSTNTTAAAGPLQRTVRPPLYDQAALDTAVAAERERWRQVQASREALRSAARNAHAVLQSEGTKYGRLCEQLEQALRA